MFLRLVPLLALLPACRPDDTGDTGDFGGDWTRWVDPFIGTDDSDSPHPVPGGAGGSAYPGATLPFGMVQFSPDTPNASPSGYRYSDTEIDQFSFTHLDGAGCPNDEDIPLLPLVGALDSSPGSNWGIYRAAYDKASEIATPGYYAVHLDTYDVLAELTATTRTGLARFTFPATDEAKVVLHTGRSGAGTHEGSLQILPPNTIQGTVTAGNFCFSEQMFQIHFVMEFDQPFTGYGTWVGAELSEGATTAEGSPTGGWVEFDATQNPVVQVRTGLSYVSVENAAENLAAEAPDWDFDGTRAAAGEAWNEVLSRVEVQGGAEEDLVKFYTALYRVFQNPNTASDVSGEYMGFDDEVHVASGVRYQNFSGWDIIRSWTHLVSAIAPEAPDILDSMVQDGVEGGLLPFWTHQNVETNVMVGDPGTVNVANAWAMGVRGFDEQAALDLMMKSADDPYDTQRWALSDWLELHYVSNAAVSLEYAMADFALAQYTDALGAEEDAARYLERSAWWKESWNAEDGYIEPRLTPGSAGSDAARIYEFEAFGPDDPGEDLALLGTATASASCNSNEGPEKAINGTWNGGSSDKWCDNRSSEKWWLLDLGEPMTLDRFVLHHAGAGGESAAWNTQDFDLSVSVDGTDWTIVGSVRGNADDTTTHEIDPVEARFVRLDILTAIQQGTWDCQPLDPADDCGFIEGNAAQYVWMVPHDLGGLVELMGGRDAARVRLDDLFTELNAGTDRPYFYIGNEPEHGTPWTYHYLGAPSETRAVVRRIVDETFTTGPGGLPGNDDLGATSAWLVWAYLGLYPVVPGTDVLVLHGPFFPEVRVHLAGGGTLAIHADDAGGASVQGVKVDGTPVTRSWLSFADIADGAALDFGMSDAASTWGTSEEDVPPSWGP